MATTASSRRAVAASQAGVAEVAAEMFARGNAVDAVVAAVLAAAALEASVLLGPVQLLVGGAGAGLRAVDGRCMQPGRGAARPRGFLAGEPIPPAARVATPVMPAALATAVASFGARSFAQVAAPAVKLARGQAEARGRVLERVARHGATALMDAQIVDELVAAAGRVPGGLLGRADLAEARPAVEACAVRKEGERRVARAPWAAPGPREARTGEDPAEESGGASSANVHVVAATDGRGLVAVACYEAPMEGVEIAELGLVAPFFAAPVARGETRVRPGERRPATCPIALAEHESVVDLAAGAFGPSADEALCGFLDALGRGEAVELALGAARGSIRGVARSRDGARPISAR